MSEAANGTPEYRVLDALFNADDAALARQFSSGVNIDAPRVGRSTGEAAGRDLCQRWPSLYNLAAGQAKLTPRFVTSAEGRCIVEVMAAVTGVDGAPLDLPMVIIGQRGGDGKLTEARIYHYEKPLTGEIGFRPSAFARRDEDRFGVPEDMPGVNADYFRAANGGDVEGALRLFAPDAYIEIGGKVVDTPAQLRTMYEFFLKEAGMQLLFSCMTFDGTNFVLEWTAGHANREAGLAVYEADRNGKIRAIRMYDTFDPANIPGLLPA
jgi:hypothetical protein